MKAQRQFELLRLRRGQSHPKRQRNEQAGLHRRIQDSRARRARKGEAGGREGSSWRVVSPGRSDLGDGAALGTSAHKGRSPRLEPKTKGRPPKGGIDGAARKHKHENERLLKQNAQLQAELQKAKIIIDVQKKLSALLGIEPQDPDRGRNAVTAAALTYLVALVGIAAACRALSVNRASYYRWQKPPAPKKPRPRSARGLSDDEKKVVLETLDSERFMEKTPYEIYPELLDENEYLCSVRTMYRVLLEHGQVRDRRDQRRHPVYVKPRRTRSARAKSGVVVGHHENCRP